MKKVVVIGAGPGGICAGIKLKEAGYDDFVIFEQADGVGGAWRHNSYPGCRCDVPSSLYSFSFAVKTDWSERYAPQPEILAYLEDLVARHGLSAHIRLRTAVESAAWNEAEAAWTLRLADGSRHRADVLIGAVGLFNQPLAPEIRGMETFQGQVMHSARWDHTVSLAGRDVAVIGSAASAVQIVPEIAEEVGRLTVFQRTPNHVRPRVEYTPEERRLLIGNREAMLLDRGAVYEWVDAICALQDPKVLAEGERDCAAALSVVADPDTRERLRPDFPFASKRPLVSSDWYPTFNRSNVQLVTEPIERIEKDGVLTRAGSFHAASVLILATGFHTTRFMAAIGVAGRNGRRLDDEWRDGARAYLGITVSAFPNLFMLYGPNTNNGSILFNIEQQVDYTMRRLAQMEQRGVRWIDVRQDVLDRYNDQLQADIRNVGPWQGSTNNYYRASSGLNVTQWPHGMSRYAQEVGRDDFDAYDAA